MFKFKIGDIVGCCTTAGVELRGVIVSRVFTEDCEGSEASYYVFHKSFECSQRFLESELEKCSVK